MDKVKDKLNELQQEVSPFKIYIEKEIPMLENHLEYYWKSDGATKKKILNCIFTEKLVLETRGRRRGETENRKGGDRKSVSVCAISPSLFFSTPNG